MNSIRSRLTLSIHRFLRENNIKLRLYYVNGLETYGEHELSDNNIHIIRLRSGLSEETRREVWIHELSHAIQVNNIIKKIDGNKKYNKFIMKSQIDRHGNDFGIAYSKVYKWYYF